MTTPQSTLARLLQLEPNSHTCIGHAKTQGRRCQCPIAFANRQEAAQILLDITRLGLQSPELDTKLEELASRLLCINRRNRHQGQVAAIKREWRQDLQNHQALEAAHDDLSHGGNDEANNNDEEEEERPRQQANPEFLSSSSQQQETTYHHQADILPTAAPSTIEHTNHTTAPSIQIGHTTTATEEARQEEPTNEAEPTSSVSSSIPTQKPHPQHQDSSHHPAAHHHGRISTHCDCAICRADLSAGGDNTCCGARCGRSLLHADCIDLLWRAASREATEEEGRRLERIIGKFCSFDDDDDDDDDARYHTCGVCILADVFHLTVTRNGPTTEIVLLLLLCCGGGSASMLLALIAWSLFLFWSPERTRQSGTLN